MIPDRSDGAALRTKEVILLTYYWGMSAREVASTYARSPSTVYLQAKSSAKLKTQLEGWYHDE